MTALAANINLQTRGLGGKLRDYLVADNVHIYKGGIVAIDSSGYARPARNTVGDVIVGVAEAEFDNTIVGHAAGARDARGSRGVKVRSGIDVSFLCTATAAQTSVGEPFYALDDQTVQATATNNPVGVVTEYVSATRVWVFIPDAPATYGAAFQGNVTAIDGDVRVTAGNVRLGAVSAFATTEPTSWAVFKQGTQPVGAIATSGGIGANATTVQKIIAAGTVNNVET